MAKEKGLPGGTAMLLLSLLKRRDMYGYEMIEELRIRSNRVFELKAGTLYPLLHTLEAQGFVDAYDGGTVDGRVRRYYTITEDGRAALTAKAAEWSAYSDAVNGILGGACCAANG